MQDILARIQSHALLLQSALGDPLFLLTLCASFLAGLYWGWLRGIAVTVFLAALRVVVMDWQQFVPGAEPSATLAEIFLFTVILGLLAVLVGKLCRAVIFLSVRQR